MVWGHLVWYKISWYGMVAWYWYEWDMVWVFYSMGTMEVPLNQSIHIPHRYPKMGDWSVSITTNFLIFFVLIYWSAQNASILLLTQSDTTLYSIMMPTMIRHLLKSSLQLLFTGLDITGMLLVQWRSHYGQELAMGQFIMSPFGWWLPSVMSAFIVRQHPGYSHVQNIGRGLFFFLSKQTSL